MTGSKPKKRVKRKQAAAVETEPDAWERFQSAVKTVAPPKTPKQSGTEKSEIDITADVSALSKVLSEIAAQPLVGLLNSAPKIIEGFVNLLEFPDELARIEVGTTLRAGEVRVRFNPSDRLLGLVAAIRAGNVE